MLADLDTRPGEDYAPGAEVLRPAVAEGDPAGGLFGAARDGFDELIGFLEGGESAGMEHAELEQRIADDGREILRLGLQAHLDLRSAREQRVERVADAGGIARPSAEPGHERSLLTVLGEVRVSRIAYRARGERNLCPADARLNLPVEGHSHGLRRLTACEAARGSYDDARDAIRRATGQALGKRQAEQLAGRAAVDFDAFYAQRPPETAEDQAVLVLSCDGKGVVMRPDALRAQTAKQAAKGQTKLKTRLSKGEKPNRKRVAEVAAVYDIKPVARTAGDVIALTDAERDAAPDAPKATGKWLTASITDDAATVIAAAFDEAQRRDPDRDRAWVALVDGNNHQITRITCEARARGAPVSILIDFIHVIEYVWKAAWSFHAEGDPAAEAWVHRQARQILEGRARVVAGNIRRQATNAGLDDKHRTGADTCARYLTNKAPYLDYPTALTSGWPIATGVIEGACRHLVKDRMDITGARWGLQGAEAILKLRAIRSNGDFDAYWAFHLRQEHHRTHRSRYLDGNIPRPTSPSL